MSHTQKCDFALTLKFVFFSCTWFRRCICNEFSTEDVEAKRVDQKDALIETLGIHMD